MTDKNLAQRILSCFIDGETERTVAQLYEITRAESLSEIETVVEYLITEKRLEKFYRVHSPYGERSGIADFKDLKDIPTTMVDEWGWDDDPREFTVHPQDIVTRYRLAQ